MTKLDLAKVNQLLDPIIDGMQADILNAVQQNVRIESIRGISTEEMPFGEGPAKALQQVLKLSQDLGFHTKNLNNAVGYAEYGSGDEMIAVLGHLDVVPAGDGWKHQPFGGECQDGILWGRGTLDDKGPAIGALYAMWAIRESGLSTSRRIRVIFGTNEETGCEDMPFYYNTQESPVMGFTPDASYPVIFAEKGIITFSLSKVLVQKNGNIKLKALSGGSAANVVPDLAHAVVFDYNGDEKTIREVGLAAHGSMPEAGENAIINLIRKLDIFDFSSELKQFFTFLLTHIGTETNGRSMGVQMQDDKSGPLTLNLAMIRLQNADTSHTSTRPKYHTPETALQEIIATINVRYPVTKNAATILQAVTDFASGAGIKVTVIGHKEPLYVKEDSELIKNLQIVYEQRTGEKVVPKAIGGGTYAKAMKNIVAFGPLFPGQEDVTHQAEENISVTHLMKNIKIMASAMYMLAN